MRNFIFLFFLVYFVPKTFAQSYFEFTAPNMALFNGYFKVDMIYNINSRISSGRFLLKPVAENTDIKIYNIRAGKWVNSFDLWENMPVLDQKVLVYLNPLGQKLIEYNFEILDKEIGKIYSTPKHMIWAYFSYQNYIAKLNENIFKMVE